MKTICPKDNCVYDTAQVTGEHVCALTVCPFVSNPSNLSGKSKVALNEPVRKDRDDSQC